METEISCLHFHHHWAVLSYLHSQAHRDKFYPHRNNIRKAKASVEESIFVSANAYSYHMRTVAACCLHLANQSFPRPTDIIFYVRQISISNMATVLKSEH